MERISSRRRRRKRSRVIEDGNNKEKHKNSSIKKRMLPNLDDSVSNFLDSQGDHLSDGEAVKSCLPLLLEERRSGLGKFRNRQWQFEALSTFTKKPENQNVPRRQWRGLAQRSIPFTQLGTPESDAVLALERKGSYVLCLGSTQESKVPLALALRFYGVPSPSALEKRNRFFGPSPTTPLFATTPLLYDLANPESEEEAIFSFRRGVSPATTPVKILISNDWNIGIAAFQPSHVWREEGTVGTLVLFTLPRNQTSFKVTKVFQCPNVRFGSDASFTPRNLLWKVYVIPIFESETTGNKISPCFNLPGYLLLNDEDDGFRLTWSIDQSWNVKETCCKEVIRESPLRNGVDAVAKIISRQDSWEEFQCDILTGERLPPQEQTPTVGIDIISEAFLHVDVLLGEILSHHKGMAEIHPEFQYNLISLQEGGRVADLVIAFTRKQKSGALGVFVQIDLFTGRFQEMDWVKSMGSKDVSALRRWCNTLSLNRRMTQSSVGPYSMGTKRAMDWTRLCEESYFDKDEDDNVDPSVWEDYVESAKSIMTKKPPKLVSFSSLYPHCDLVTNDAILSCLPVSSLQCKDSPIQLVYG